MCAISFRNDFSIYILEIGDYTNLASWKLIEQFRVFNGDVNNLKWSSTDKLLATSLDNNAIVVEKENGKKWTSNLIVMNRQYRTLMTMAWAKDGEKFALAGGNRALYIGKKNEKTGLFETQALEKCTHFWVFIFS